MNEQIQQDQSEQQEIDTNDTEQISTITKVSRQMVTQNHSQVRRVTHKMTFGDSNSEVFCTKFDPEDRYVACGYGDGIIRIYNLETGKLAFNLGGYVTYSGGHILEEMPITGVRWRPQSHLLKTMNVLVSTQADGSIKHWHATSGKCLHSRNDDPDNHLYCLDYNNNGTYLAVAGRDSIIRVYDETTKSLLLQMKDKNEFPGHSNRVFCVKFNQISDNLLYSGGWDNTLCINDLREKGPVGQIYGPHICGDAIDLRNDGVTLLTGSYRQDDCLQIWDLRTQKCVRVIDWDGPQSAADELTSLYQDKDDNSPNKKQKKRPVNAPFLYAAQFNKKQDIILAGGAGKNELRIFDYETGNIVCIISDMERSILAIDVMKTQSGFAFGSADSCTRIMELATL